MRPKRPHTNVADELDEWLGNLTRETWLSKSYYMKVAMQEFREQREYHVLGIAALERGEPTISLEAPEKELDRATI